MKTSYRENPPKIKKGPGLAVIEFVQALAFALALVFIIRFYLVQVYVIPTGSMAPTLLGRHIEVTCWNDKYRFNLGLKNLTFQEAICPNCRARNRPRHARVKSGDRIFAIQFFHRLHKPSRWESFVFKWPEDPTRDFIKRLVGLPGESLEIRNGDIYINGSLAPKPISVQESLWIPVYDNNFLPEDGSKFWKVTSGSWNEQAGLLEGEASSETGPAEASYALPILDLYGYDSAGNSGDNFVGDLKISADISSRKGLIRLGVERILICGEVTKPERKARTVRERFTLSLPINLPEENITLQDIEGKILTEVPLPARLRNAQSYHIDFLAYDGRIVVSAGGKRLFSLNLKALSPRPYRTQNAGITLTVERGTVRLENLKIFRDIFYLPVGFSGRGPVFLSRSLEKVEIPKGFYFALGDNSPSSLDSRAWGFIPENLVEGRAFVVFWPIRRWRLIY